VTGVSSSARIQNGAYVNQQSGPLTYVAQLDPMWVDFSISEDEMLKLREQRKTGRLRFPENEAFVVEIVLADGSIYPENGRIFFGRQCSSQTGTFLIRATFDNPEDCFGPGSSCAQCLKAQSVGRDPGAADGRAAGRRGFFVWVVDKDGKAQTRPIEVGDWRVTTGSCSRDSPPVTGDHRRHHPYRHRGTG
jgi:membrane fusion protein (multidrug efflux system)